MAYYPAYLEKASTRRALHVGNLSYADSAEEVEKHLLKDMMQSVTPLVQVSFEGRKGKWTGDNVRGKGG
jgi:hypothetical protein